MNWVEQASGLSFPASDSPGGPDSDGMSPTAPLDVSCPSLPATALAQIARHEAGHAVVGHLLGLDLLDTDLHPDPNGGRGHTRFARPGGWFDPRPDALAPAETDFIERLLTTFMAGQAAEARSGGADPDGSVYDTDEASGDWARFLTGSPRERRKLLGGFRERAERVLERAGAWNAVEAVASELLAHGRLDGQAVVRSIDAARSQSE